MKIVQVEEPHKHWPGPTLLLAGPGSGKTHSLALRIKWLVEEKNVDPQKIIILTFTTEAARNMRLRLSDEGKKAVYMPKEQQPGTIRTMHSLGHEIIRRSLDAVGLREDFRVVESDDLREALFGDAAQLLDYDRGMGKKARECRMKAETMPERSTEARVCEEYSRILRACNAIDYDDQIGLACKILKGNEELLQDYQGQASHLLVDEYQDINRDQFTLIRLLSSKSPEGLYVVGDDDQSIYRFRGGSPAFIKGFKEDFSERATILSLPSCRRCPPKVLAGALGVVKRYNDGRLSKPDPSATKTDGASILLHDIPSDDREARIIAGVCREVLPKGEVLILLPTGKFAEPIKRALRKSRIRYESRSALEDEGLTQLGRAFDFLASPDDSLTLRECIRALCENGSLSIPSRLARKKEKKELREAGLKTISSLWGVVCQDKISLVEALRQSSMRTKDPLLKELREHIETLQKAYETGIDSFLEAVGKVLKPWGKPDELAREVKSYIEEMTGRRSLGEGIVRIMTMRMAKGLEADHVFVVGLEDEVLPGRGVSGEELAEKARLFYVSMTRAKTHLHLTHARKRSASVTFLPDSYALKRSRFLDGIPKDCLEVKYMQSEAKKSIRRGS